MNNTNFNCSLNDTTILRNLILENPELPVLIFAGEEAWTGDHSYNQVDASRGEIEKLTLYGDKWLNKEDYEDELYDDLYVDNKKQCKTMTDEEYDKLVDEKVNETEFIEAIVIWVG